MLQFLRLLTLSPQSTPLRFFAGCLEALIFAALCSIPVFLTAAAFKPLSGSHKRYRLYGLLLTALYCLIPTFQTLLFPSAAFGAAALGVGSVLFCIVEYLLLKKPTKSPRRLLLSLVLQWCIVFVLCTVGRQLLILFLIYKAL